MNVVILDELRSRNDGLNEWGRMTSVGIRYHREEYRLHKTVRSHYVVYLYNLMSLKTFKTRNTVSNAHKMIPPLPHVLYGKVLVLL